MTIRENVDWSIAPKGATHKRGSIWYKETSTGFWYWEDGCWWESVFKSADDLIQHSKVYSNKEVETK